jgi:hypothetical protein
MEPLKFSLNASKKCESQILGYDESLPNSAG